MGMNITPLTRPEVPLTTSNLIVDSDLSMMNYNLQANNVHVGGSILQVVECIPSETVILTIGNKYANSTATQIILPFLNSTYYTGSLKAKTIGSGVFSSYFTFYNVDGSNTIINIPQTAYFNEFNIPDGTIGVVARTDSAGSGWSGIDIGWTYDYLPLPTPPNIL